MKRRSASVVAFLGLNDHPPRTDVAYVLVRFVVYVIALICLVLIFGTKARGLFIAPPVGLLGAAATWYLLGDTPVERRRRLLLAAAVGFILAQVTWAFGYWNVPAAVGGAGLWLGFYVLSGVVEHGASHSVERRIVLEYGLVGLVGALVILGVARPWSL